MTLNIRPFAPEEWQLFKTVRLKALASDPSAFGRSYAQEATFTDQEWQARLQDTDAAMFGIFENGALIGMTGLYIHPEDPQTTRFMADWLEPAARGKGYAAKMHEARTAWAKARPGIHRLSICYRADNTTAKRIGEKFGFTFTHADDHIWPDGANVPLHHYELRL
jgi:RimJ/RimL family protein N-acetyltransferase